MALFFIVAYPLPKIIVAPSFYEKIKTVDKKDHRRRQWSSKNQKSLCIEMMETGFVLVAFGRIEEFVHKDIGGDEYNTQSLDGKEQ